MFLTHKGVAPTKFQNPLAFLEYAVNVLTKPSTLGTHRTVSAAGLHAIKNHEGLRLRKYKCAAGLWTIGYGHLIKKGENFDKGITEYEAESLLKKDLAIAESCVNYSVFVPLTQNQFDALVSLVFNIGTFSFKRSTLLRLLNQKKYVSAAEQFLVWCKAGNPLKTVPGLLSRRHKERLMFLKDG